MLVVGEVEVVEVMHQVDLEEVEAHLVEMELLTLEVVEELLDNPQLVLVARVSSSSLTQPLDA